VNLATAVRERARELGFLACGITDPSPTPHAAELDTWLAKGYAGTMRYLHRQAKRRKNPKINVPEALSVVVVLDNYYWEESEPDTRPPRIARYARGQDYHQVTRQRLVTLGEFLLDHGARIAHSYVDNGPIPERELAQRAGLGWIGKNTMVIRPGAGSFFFIGTIFTDLSLLPDQPFEIDHCGSCTRCLDACPTAAFVGPRVLDATRCISYLTIEQRGPIPNDIAPHLAGYAFGCDVCNDVCPWNHRFAQQTAIEEFRPLRRLDGADAGYFDRMDEAEFAARFSDTPFSRPGLAGMRRNLHAAFASVEQHHER
jgi:epoxyqueuosine reductase